jgi:hypothetical protein
MASYYSGGVDEEDHRPFQSVTIISMTITIIIGNSVWIWLAENSL